MSGVLFVCLGNICRSPLVESVARQRFAGAGLTIDVASCGTGAWHIGEPADARATDVGRAAGYDLSAHCARQLQPEDFARYDLLLCMDTGNLVEVCSQQAAGGAVVDLFLNYAGVEPHGEVPDPYGGGSDGFRHVLDLAERGVNGLIQRLR